MAEPVVTPRPWRAGKYPSVLVADALADGEDPRGRAEPDTIAYYGGVIVAESMLTADREHVVRAVNEYEALRAAEANLRAIVDLLSGQYQAHARQLLADLDEIRRRA